MSDPEGWIKVHRKLMEWPWYFSEAFSRTQAWIDLLLLARHEETPSLFYVRGIPVLVGRGQLAWGERALSERWSWSRAKLRRFLRLLESGQQITWHKSAVVSIITITNYELYQDKRTTDGTTERPQKDHRKTDNKNVKNVKNVKNPNYEYEPSAPTPREEAGDFFVSLEKQKATVAWLVSKGSSAEAAEQELAKFVSYWTEPSPDGKKQRWEMQKAFEIKRRLVTWMGRASKSTQVRRTNVTII